MIPDNQDRQVIIGQHVAIGKIFILDISAFFVSKVVPP